jgi:hypothetical protein
MGSRPTENLNLTTPVCNLQADLERWERERSTEEVRFAPPDGPEARESLSCA